MSSYLNIYLQPKKEEKKKLLLTSYGRASNVYQTMNENAHITFIGNGDDYQYTTLTADTLRSVIADVKEEFDGLKKRLDAYKQYLHTSKKGVDDILELEDTVKELRETIMTIQTLYDIAYDIETGCSDFEGMYVNID